MKNLKLSLSKSARAIDLKKYPKVSVDSENQTSPPEGHPQAPKPTPVDVAQEKAQKDAIAKQKAEEQAKLKAQQDAIAKQKAEEQAKLKAQKDAIAKQKAEEQAKLKAQKDAIARKAEEKPTKTKEDDKKQLSEKASPVKKPKRLLTQSSRTIPKIMDPTRRRDNATVRLGASQGGQPSFPEDKIDDSRDPNSDTVVLKVIKEKKKKLAGILSASQTIRLRPPSEPGFTPGGSSPPATEPAIPKKTLKLKTPGSAAESDQSAPQTLERRVLKLKSDAPTAPPDAGEQTTIRRSQGRRVVQKSGTPTAKATLKIKVPSSDHGLDPESADDRQLKATLKIKSPTSPAASASAPVSPPRAARTAGKPITKMGQSGPAKAKTLKLKAVPRSEFQQLTPAATGTQADKTPAQQVEASKPHEGASFDTDIFYTISAAASVAVVGAVIYLMASQLTSLF